jgi:Asp-tRNA(Asn)/Glu-tRNA(Gln) amidotransferase B subunit
MKLMNEELQPQACSPVDYEEIINFLMLEHSEKIDQTKSKPAMLGWWVGQVMKISRGKANPSVALKILQQKLNAYELPKKLNYGEDVRDIIKSLENGS